MPRVIYQTVSSVDALTLMDDLPANSVDLVLTDIPYNVVNRKSGGLRNLDKKQADVLTFQLAFFLRQCFRISRGSIFICCGDTQLSTIMQFFKDRKVPNRMFPWCKTNPSPMNGKRIPLSAVEMAVYAKKPASPYYGHCEKNFWIGPTRRQEAPNTPCPTPKPLAFFRRVIELTTKPGDLVVDPCVGSGTTLVACKELQRSCIAGDTNRLSVDYAKARLRNTRCSRFTR